MRISDWAHGLLSNRVIPGCRREAFDPVPGKIIHVRRLLDGLQVRQRQPYLRIAPANVALERLAAISTKRQASLYPAHR